MKSEARFALALALLLLAYVLQGFTGTIVEPLVDLLFILLFLIVLIDPTWPKLGIAAGLLAVAVSASLTLAYGATDNLALGAWSSVLNATLLFWSVVLVLVRVARQRVVTISTVFGALLAYALLGFAFASVYAAIDLATGDAIFAQGVVPQADYVYFSFVTLTTLGFGDLTPALDIIKRLVVVEALIGQIFLVVLVARLVSLWARPQDTGQNTEAQ
ncbi:MAG: potassium channel family protein [Candidatus Nanopelagicales bacterium]|jgi:voltage-gated potassium channel Kch